MATLRNPRKYQSLIILFQFFLLIQIQLVLCYQYKVGDLNAWNIPSSANKDVYLKWSKNHIFKLGDSICKSTFLAQIFKILPFFDTLCKNIQPHQSTLLN